jgi:hypothetical protein
MDLHTDMSAFHHDNFVFFAVCEYDPVNAGLCGGVTMDARGKEFFSTILSVDLSHRAANSA